MTDKQYKRFRYLYEKGYNDGEIAKKMCVSQSTVQKWRKKYKMKANWEPNGKNSHSRTICWTCQNACGGCSWSKRFIPVEGWDATPHMLYAWDRQHDQVQSYEVHRCPQYVPDPPREPVLPGPTPPVIQPPPARDHCVGCNNFGLCSNRGWTCKDKATWEVAHG